MKRFAVIFMFSFWIFLIYSPCFSGEIKWEEYSRLGNDKITAIQFSVSSPVQMIDENRFQIWFKAEDMLGGIDIEYLEFNCQNKTRTLLQKTVFDSAEKKKRYEQTNVGVVRFLEPGSIYDQLAQTYCEDLRRIYEFEKKQEKSN